MAIEEIKGGLEWAVRKGEPIKEAMMSFYNAGYDRLEIEKAASELLRTTELVPIDITEKVQPSVQINKNKIINQRRKIIPQINPSQRINSRPVSQYPTQMSPKKNSFVVVILVVVLLLLFSVLIGAFFFKDSILNFINSSLH